MKTEINPAVPPLEFYE